MAKPVLTWIPSSKRLFNILFVLTGISVMAFTASILWLRADHGPAAASTALPPAVESTPLIESDFEPEIAIPAKPKSKEEKRFARADRDDDGQITVHEYLSQRKRNYDKLDTNGDGRLSFEEYAASGYAKFQKADSNADKILTPSEFASTAPAPRKASNKAQTACKCENSGEKSASRQKNATQVEFEPNSED